MIDGFFAAGLVAVVVDDLEAMFAAAGLTVYKHRKKTYKTQTKVDLAQ